MKQLEKRILFDIVTFENLRNKGKSLVSILNNIFNMYILPMGIQVLIQVVKVNGRNKTYAYNKKDYMQICDSLMKGEIQFLFVFENSEISPISSDIRLSITCDYAQEYEGWPLKNPVANTISLSINKNIWGGIVTTKTQEEIVNLLIKAFIELEGIYAYITCGCVSTHFGPKLSGLENLQNFNYLFSSYTFKDTARGYFWGNIISESHIEGLGGIDNVLRESPCFAKEVIEFGNRKALYLQLTKDINEFSDVELRSLKSHLNPILMKEDINLINQNDPNGEYRNWYRLVFD